MDVIGVTNRSLCTDFYKRIKEISRLNLKYLIIREKDLDSDSLLKLADKVKKILGDSKIKLIINSDVSVAKKINAYGVQLSFENFINKTYKYDGIIGVSVHSFEEAVKAELSGADYLIYGHVFKTDCKKGVKPRGLKELSKICEKVKVPVYAIGGITCENYKDVLETNASGVAIMSSLMQSKGNELICLK